MIEKTSRAAYVRSISQTYNKLAYRFEHARKLEGILEATIASERAHRQMGKRFDDAKYAVPVSTAAEIQVLMHLANDVVNGPYDAISAAFVSGVRPENVQMRALAILERDRLLETFTAEEWAELAELNYAEAVHGEAWS